MKNKFICKDVHDVYMHGIPVSFIKGSQSCILFITHILQLQCVPTSSDKRTAKTPELFPSFFFDTFLTNICGKLFNTTAPVNRERQIQTPKLIYYPYPMNSNSIRLNWAHGLIRLYWPVKKMLQSDNLNWLLIIRHPLLLKPMMNPHSRQSPSFPHHWHLGWGGLYFSFEVSKLVD